VQAADDDPAAGGIGQRKREALVSAGVLEGVEADEPDALDRLTTCRLDDRGACSDIVQLAPDGIHPPQMGFEHAAEVGAVGAPGQGVHPTTETADLASEKDDKDKEDENRDAKGDGERADDGLHEGVEVDRGILRGRPATGRASERRESNRQVCRARTARRRRRRQRDRWRPMLSSGAILSPLGVPISPMAKRSRLAARPGQRRPLQRSGRPDGAERLAGRVTADEEARAAELEAQIVAQERAAEAARRPRERTRGADAAGVSYTSVPLSARAADEYAYVKRDVRRIALVGGFLIAILAVLEVLVNGMHLFTL
jgi:hypothetical protein